MTLKTDLSSTLWLHICSIKRGRVEWKSHLKAGSLPRMQETDFWLLRFSPCWGTGSCPRSHVCPCRFLATASEVTFLSFKKSSCSWTHSFQIWESILKNNNQCRQGFTQKDTYGIITIVKNCQQPK